MRGVLVTYYFEGRLRYRFFPPTPSMNAARKLANRHRNYLMREGFRVAKVFVGMVESIK